MSEGPDYVVLRHGLDIPDEYRAEHLEGRWYDVGTVPTGRARGDVPPEVGMAIAEPTGRFECRDDGAVAEVWELRLATPRERRTSSDR